MSQALCFNDVQFEIISRNGQPWITARQLSQALGYAREDSVLKIYERNKEEFSSMMSATVKMTVGLTEVVARIFSMRGCHLVGMLSRTPVAKAFRRWVLDVLDRLAAEERAALPEVPHIAITPSTTASRKPLEKLVKVWARQSGLIVGDCWTMLNAAFNLQSITELPEEWIPDAIAWVQGKIDNLTPALPAAEPVPAPALPATDDIDGHFAAIREHIRQINNHEDAIFQAARKGMPPLRGTNFLALLIHRNMENAGWSLHYALKSLETSARIAVTAGQI